MLSVLLRIAHRGCCIELLVITLAHTIQERDADARARIRMISNTVSHAPGLVTAHLYRSRGNATVYFLLTTWNDEESWQQAEAQDRYNPKHLLLTSVPTLLIAPPQQWLMRYCWGYSRPAFTPLLSVIRLATIRSDQTELIQRTWIESLRQQAAQSLLSFAFLASGNTEGIQSTSSQTQTRNDNSYEDQRGCLFLDILSYTNETDQAACFANQNYQALNRLLGNMGNIQTDMLDPL